MAYAIGMLYSVRRMPRRVRRGGGEGGVPISAEPTPCGENAPMPRALVRGRFTSA